MAIYVSDADGKLTRYAGNFKAAPPPSPSELDLLWSGITQGGASVTIPNASNYKYLIFNFSHNTFATYSVIFFFNQDYAIASGGGLASALDGIHQGRVAYNGNNNFTVTNVGYWNAAGWQSRNGQEEYSLRRVWGGSKIN